MHALPSLGKFDSYSKIVLFEIECSEILETTIQRQQLLCLLLINETSTKSHK